MGTGSARAGTVVLVADDHSDSLEILTYLVSAEGGSVRSARTSRNKRRCAEAGFAEHIGKPYDPGL